LWIVEARIKISCVDIKNKRQCRNGNEVVSKNKSRCLREDKSRRFFPFALMPNNNGSSEKTMRATTLSTIAFLP